MQPAYDHIDDITALWEGCRLANVRKAALEVTLEFASFTDLWLPFLGGSTGLAGFARDLNEATAGALANRVQEIVEREYGKSAFVLTARAWAVAGLVTGS